MNSRFSFSILGLPAGVSETDRGHGGRGLQLSGTGNVAVGNKRRSNGGQIKRHENFGARKGGHADGREGRPLLNTKHDKFETGEGNPIRFICLEKKTTFSSKEHNCQRFLF